MPSSMYQLSAPVFVQMFDALTGCIEKAIADAANFDARVRFETRAARGNPKRALRLLDKLDRAD